MNHLETCPVTLEKKKYLNFQEKKNKSGVDLLGKGDERDEREWRRTKLYCPDESCYCNQYKIITFLYKKTFKKRLHVWNRYKEKGNFEDTPVPSISCYLSLSNLGFSWCHSQPSSCSILKHLFLSTCCFGPKFWTPKCYSFLDVGSRFVSLNSFRKTTEHNLHKEKLPQISFGAL